MSSYTQQDNVHKNTMGMDARFYGMMRELLAYRAQHKDHYIYKELLKRIVFSYAEAERKLSMMTSDLQEKQRQLEDDLRAAAEIQGGLLPQKLAALENLDIAWKLMPSAFMSGDIFDVYQLDEDHAGLYMMDVSGHGLPSSIVTVSVSQTLRPRSGHVMRKSTVSPGFDITPPREVMSVLDKEYPIERFDKFFTIVYMTINLKTGRLLYSNAAHPPPVLIRSNASIELLDKGGTIIGMGGLIPFDEEEKLLRKGDRIILYTDGLVEHTNLNDEQYGMERLLTEVTEHQHMAVEGILEAILSSVSDFGGDVTPKDDISLMGVEFSG